jgi:hypothetical protein
MGALKAMIFSMSLGTAGSGDDRYTLYVPFSMSPSSSISNIEKSASVVLAGYDVRIEKLVNFFALTIQPFATEEEAARFFPKARAALLWASLKQRAGISAPTTLSQADLFPTPKSVNPGTDGIREVFEKAGWREYDGGYDADKAVVRPEMKKLVRWEMGRARAILSTSSANFCAIVTEALAFASAEKVLGDERLQLAIELYATHSFEVSDKAQFIGLVTVLEALVPESQISSDASSALAKAKTAVQQARDAVEKNTATWTDLNHLLSRIGGLEDQAIGTAMRMFVAEAAARFPALGNPAELTQKIRAAYNLRSDLLHEGRSEEDLKTSLGFLRDFVPKLLQHLFVEQAQHVP